MLYNTQRCTCLLAVLFAAHMAKARQKRVLLSGMKMEGGGGRGLQGDFGILWGHYNCSTVYQLREMCDTANKVVVVAVVVMTARSS